MRTIAAGAILAAFLGLELAVILTVANGPTLDEGIYLAAGQRTLEGVGGTDGYLFWFAGSLLWPVLAGIGGAVDGLDGARVIAAILVTIGIVGAWRASAALFGSRAGLCTAALAVGNGPILALAHLAVIDTLAVAGLGCALWFVAELWRRDHRAWLVAAAAAFTLAVLAKYPVAACGAPLLLLLVVLRGRRARMDVAVFVAIVAAVLGSYYLAERPQLVGFLHWRTVNNPNFGVTPTIVAALQVWYGGVPLVLGLGGWLACRRRAVGSALLLGAVVFPAYHLSSANGVGDSKHAVYGALFTLPLGGLLLSRLPRDAAGRMLLAAIVIVLGAFGLAQAWRLDHSWIDVDPAARYLADHARPGQRFLIDDSWPFGQRLYAAGKVGNPRDVVDPYRLAHERLGRSVCRYDWFVAAQGAGQWSPAFRDKVAACGTYRRVFVSRGRVVVLGADLRFMTLTAEAEVFRNVRAHPKVRR